MRFYFVGVRGWWGERRQIRKFFLKVKGNIEMVRDNKFKFLCIFFSYFVIFSNLGKEVVVYKRVQRFGVDYLVGFLFMVREMQWLGICLEILSIFLRRGIRVNGIRLVLRMFFFFIKMFFVFFDIMYICRIRGFLQFGLGFFGV